MARCKSYLILLFVYSRYPILSDNNCFRVITSLGIIQYTIMKRYLLLLNLLILITSCSKHEEIRTIGETEYFFDEKLSSISPDPNGSFWVGSETGEVFNFKDNHRVVYDLEGDRIYKVGRDLQAPEDSLFWIAIRNSGLQKWKMNTDNQLERIKTYNINFKQDHYSPYDFLSVGNRIYVATSQGFYYLDKTSDADSLSLIFPSTEFLSKHDGTTFVVHNICQYTDTLLLAASQSGLLWHNTKTHSTRVSFDNNYVDHVSVYNDTIYTILKEDLYLNNVKGEVLTKINTGFRPKMYYQVQGVHYLVGAEEILLSNDLKDFFRIRLKRAIPTGSRNLILPDVKNNFTYLLTENAVWRISNNIDVFKSNKAIKAVCSNAENIYYLSLRNELYVQNKKSNEAKWLYTFSDENLIQKMNIIGDELYFYNIDNEFQKMRISDSWIKNTLFNSPKVIFQSEARITAEIVKPVNGEVTTYLGIQDGLVTIDQNGTVTAVPELSKSYITSMFAHEDTDRLYISTLNNGVFYISRDEVRQISQTANLSFINDIITTNNHNSNLIMLTNQQIISQNPSDSIKIKGCKKLLYASDSVFYCLPEFGIRKFEIADNKIIDKGLFYKDIRFNSNSILTKDGKIYLISNVGSLSLSTGKDMDPTWVHFEDAVNINMLEAVLVTLVLLLLVVAVIIVLVKKHNAHILQIKKRKEDLSKRVEDLSQYSHILDDARNQEILKMKNQITAIDIKAKNRKETNIRLEEFSLQIAKLNRQLTLLLPKKIDEQIEQIAQTNTFETAQLLEESQTAKMLDDIEVLKEQIGTNEKWLQQRTQLHDSLSQSIENLSDCVEIEGVNKNIYTDLLAIQDGEKIKPLSELINLQTSLNERIQQIDDEKSTSAIADYISDMGVYLNSKSISDSGLIFISDALNAVKLSQSTDQNLLILRKLKPIDAQYQILKILDSIDEYAIRYRELHDQITKENNEQVNKKFDKELASFISDNTQDLTRRINSLIKVLYSHLLQSDKRVVVDILKLANTEGQHARVLALLIADLKIKRSLIPGMLGIYGNLNPVISRLVNDRIRANEHLLNETQKSNKEKSVFVYLTLRLLS